MILKVRVKRLPLVEQRRVMLGSARQIGAGVNRHAARRGLQQHGRFRNQAIPQQRADDGRAGPNPPLSSLNVNQAVAWLAAVVQGLVGHFKQALANGRQRRDARVRQRTDRDHREAAGLGRQGHFHW